MTDAEHKNIFCRLGEMSQNEKGHPSGSQINDRLQIEKPEAINDVKQLVSVSLIFV